MLEMERGFSLLGVNALVLRTAVVDAVLARLVFAPAPVHSSRTERLAVALLHSRKLVRTGTRGKGSKPTKQYKYARVFAVCIGCCTKS